MTGSHSSHHDDQSPPTTDILSKCKSLSASSDSSKDDANKPVIGIKIGVTSMSAAICRNGRVIIVPNEKGSRQTPAVIAFTPNGVIVGQEAVDQSLTNASNTIRGPMRMIGKKVSDLQSEFPGNKFTSHNSKPVVEVDQKGEKKLTAEDLMSVLIGNMVHVAETYSNKMFVKGVIAVPPYITPAQKNMIKSAAESSGLLVKLLDQPIAACIAHRLDQRVDDYTILVLHCGGETTSATIVRKSRGKLMLKGTTTYHHLGGRNFDDKLFDSCRDKFLADHHISLENHPKDAARLREAVVKAKITLSSLDEAVISIAGLHAGKDFRDRISRSQFEQLCGSLFQSVSAVVSEALKLSNIDPENIDKVVLTGGSTRIPSVRSIMKATFGKDAIAQSDHFTSDQAVIYGTVVGKAGKQKKRQLPSEQKRTDGKKQRKGKGSEAVIGIDLGTTYSSVGVFQNGEAVIIPNEQGNRTTPSCVAFTSTGRLIGDPAKDHATIDPKNTVFEIKRLIGMKHDDIAIMDDIKGWLFAVVNENSKPRIEVEYQDQLQRFYAEDISGFILSKLKDTAEKYTGKTITKAVITVPAYFNEYQRVATKTAAEIAGLTDVKILTEPTAAAIAHGLDHSEDGTAKKTILVYDLGGGTFDVTLLSIQDRNIEVITTAGDTHLGGKDFDSRLVDHFCKQFLLKHGQDISSDVKAISRLRQECEKMKIRLSDFVEAEVDIDSLFNGIRFVDTITRTAFENLCGDLFFKTLGPLMQALTDAEIAKEAIDDLVLVGGSTRIPKIRELVIMFFNGKQFRQDVHPEEAVVRGAVMRSAMLFADTELSDVQVQEVTPLSLGIEVFGGLMSTVIPRNTAIPVTRTQMYKTTADDQTSGYLSAFQGERKLANDNIFLDDFVLKGIPPALRGKSKVPVTFKLDGDGVLEVAAQPKPGAPFQKMEIRDPCDLPKSEVDRMIAEAEKMWHQDKEELARVKVRNRLYFKCYDHRSDDNIGEKCQEMLEWLRDNPDAEEVILLKKLNYFYSFFD